MVDPVSWTLLGVVALTEGVKFLYGQAAELIKRHLDTNSAKTVSPVQAPAGVFVGDPELRAIDEAELDAIWDDLRTARQALSDYIDGFTAVNPADPDLLARVAPLRDGLERVYGTTLTLVGEDRSRSSEIVSRLSIDRLAGKATNVRVQHLSGASVLADSTIRTVEPGGEFVGVNIETVGDTAEPGG